MTDIATAAPRIRRPSPLPQAALAFPGRIVGLDLARLLAILGMMTEHLLLGTGPVWLETIVTGFPSTLFAVLGGVSAVLATRRLTEAGRPVAASLSILLRGLVVALLGVLLGLAPSFVIVVLVYFGVALMLTALLMHLPTIPLLGVVVALAVGGPQLNVAVHDAAALDTLGELSFGSPFEFARSVLFTGTYPVVTWLCYLLAGVLIGRLLARATERTTSVLTLGGAGAAIFAAGLVADLVSRSAVIAALSGGRVTRAIAEELVTSQGLGSPLAGGWVAVVSGAPHTGATADILRTMGAAMLVLAGLLALTRRADARVPLPLRPLQRAGAAPLTIYTVHVLGTVAGTLVITGTDVLAPPWWAVGFGALGLHVAGVLLIGALLAAAHRRGPLEALVGLVSGIPARVASRG